MLSPPSSGFSNHSSFAARCPPPTGEPATLSFETVKRSAAPSTFRFAPMRFRSSPRFPAPRKKVEPSCSLPQSKTSATFLFRPASQSWNSRNRFLKYKLFPGVSVCHRFKRIDRVEFVPDSAETTRVHSPAISVRPDFGKRSLAFPRKY